MTGTQQRFHALDAARALALLLGIVLHATMSFFLPIPAQDSSQSTTLALSFYVIHMFRMSLFFLIAGFFANMLLRRHGARRFIKDRARRIAVPMTVGWVLLAPLTIAVVIWGLSRSFPEGLPQEAGLPAPGDGLPLVHLWFLYYLCLFYLIALALHAVLQRWKVRLGGLAGAMDAGLQRCLSGGLLPWLMAVPVFAVLYLDSSWPLWFGVPTPDTGLSPKLPAMVVYGSAFALGWALFRQLPLLDLLQRQWRSNLLLALGFSVACILLVGPLPELANAQSMAGGAGMRALYIACYALAIWHWTFALLGLAMRYCAAASGLRRYLADASYWMYLLHLPLVFALQVLLVDLPLHWVLKFPLIVGLTLLVLLISYHYLVRSSAVGELLNGRRYPRQRLLSVFATPPASREADSDDALLLAGAGDASGPAPIAVLARVSKRFGQNLALDQLSLEVRPGELLAVLGPNGAGKSTAISLWLGLRQPDEGGVSVLGGSPLDVHSRLGVGVMMQEVTLAPMLSTREHIALVSSYYRDPLLVEETLALSGTAPLAARRYGELSGGQKRQVQFAIAICGRPRLLFLDEPTVGMDIEAREAIWRCIGLLRAEGCSVVLTTHYLEEAEALADRVAVLSAGKLIATGSVEEMRAMVACKRITCASSVPVEEIRTWPGVLDAEYQAALLQVTTTAGESVVRRLLDADLLLSRLEVRQASLAQAFTELTREPT